MPARRTLALRREVLQELTDADLNGVAAGAVTTRPTAASCLDYISCWWWQCVTRETLVCVE